MTSASSASRPVSRFSRLLENRHLLVAVHALDLEGRFGVELADGAGGGHRRRDSSHVRERLLAAARECAGRRRRRRHSRPARRGRTSRMPRSSRSWCDTADSLMPTSVAMSQTHSSPPASASRMRTRVGSPSTRNVSASASTVAPAAAAALPSRGAARRMSGVDGTVAVDCRHMNI